MLMKMLRLIARLQRILLLTLKAQATEVLSASAHTVRHRRGRHLLRLDGVAETPDAFSAWQDSPSLRGRCTRTFVFSAKPPAAASLVRLEEPA
jgi:hypothetical protein